MTDRDLPRTRWDRFTRRSPLRVPGARPGGELGTGEKRRVAEADFTRDGRPGESVVVRPRAIVMVPERERLVPSLGQPLRADIRLLAPAAAAGVSDHHGALARFVPAGWRQRLHREPGRHGKISLALLGVVIMMCTLVVGWRLAGGKVLTMETASMCPKICVGAVVADRPVTGPLHKGEVITFYPPGNNTETYSHEIYHIFPNGMIQTKGIRNSYHDPWLITRSNIVGRVSFAIPGLGWLLKALPMLAIAVLAWVVARPHIPVKFRRGWDRMWIAAMLILPVVILHPLLSGTITSSNGTQVIHTTVANTGLLPESFRGQGHTLARHVTPGHLANITVRTTPHAPGLPILREAASLAWWGWALVGLACGWPLIGFAWHFFRDDETPGDRARRRAGRARRRPGQRAITT